MGWEQVKDIDIKKTDRKRNCRTCGQYKSGSGTCGYNCNLKEMGFCEVCAEARQHHRAAFRTCPRITHIDKTTCSRWLPVKVDRRKVNRRDSDND